MTDRNGRHIVPDRPHAIEHHPTPRPHANDISEIFRNLAQLPAQLDRPNVQLIVRPCSGRRFADSSHLEGTLTVFVTGAVRALPQGGRIQLHLDEGSNSANGDDNQIIVELWDDGRGFSAAALVEVAELYLTGPVETECLSSAPDAGENLVTGPTLELRLSPSGSGPNAQFMLPVTLLKNRKPPPALTAAVQRHILLVEDDRSVLRSVQRRLEWLGYRVTPVDNPGDAIECLNREPVSLLLSDVMIRGRPEGLDLVARAKTQWPTLPIILTSGFLAPDKYRGLPPDIDFLAKPYRLLRLAQVLNEKLDERASLPRQKR